MWTFENHHNGELRRILALAGAVAILFGMSWGTGLMAQCGGVRCKVIPGGTATDRPTECVGCVCGCDPPDPSQCEHPPACGAKFDYSMMRCKVDEPLYNCQYTANTHKCADRIGWSMPDCEGERWCTVPILRQSCIEWLCELV